MAHRLDSDSLDWKTGKADWGLSEQVAEVAICSDVLPGVTLGGRDHFLESIAQHFQQAGARIKLVTLNRECAPAQLCSGAIDVVPVAPALVDDDLRKRSWVNSVLLALGAAWWLLWHKVDTVVLDQIPCAALPLAAVCCWLTRKRVIVHWIDPWSLEEWQGYLGRALGFAAFWGERLAFRCFPAIANSRFTADRLRAIHRRPAKSVTVVCAGIVDVAEVPKRVRRYQLGYVGRVLPHKRIDLFLRLVADVKRSLPDLRAVVVGDGEQLPWARERALALGLGDTVEFKGRLEHHDDVIKVVSDMELLVVCSEREGFGLVVLEANSQGVPALVRNSPANGSTRLIADWVNGVVCTDTEMENVALACLSDPDLQSRLIRGSLAAAQQYVSKFGVESLLRAYLGERACSGPNDRHVPRTLSPRSSAESTQLA